MVDPPRSIFKAGPNFMLYVLLFKWSSVPSVKLYSPPLRALSSNLAFVTRETASVLIVIRRRLTAQGNGQATLDYEGTRALLQEAGSPRSGSERAASAGGAVTRPGSE